MKEPSAWGLQFKAFNDCDVIIKLVILTFNSVITAVAKHMWNVMLHGVAMWWAKPTTLSQFIGNLYIWIPI